MNKSRSLLFTTAFIIIIFSIYNLYPEEKLARGKTVDSLVILKSERKLVVYSQGQQLKTYSIALGKNPVGPKEFEGDGKTPEGSYLVTGKNPESGYHRNLGISYPDTEDIGRANRLKLSPGGDIKIHGLRNGLGFIGKFHRWFDWTNGCIAVTNEEIEELFMTVRIGAKIEIRP
jgi:murein L,D-transpeptidase YafK